MLTTLRHIPPVPLALKEIIPVVNVCAASLLRSRGLLGDQCLGKHPHSSWCGHPSWCDSRHSHFTLTSYLKCTHPGNAPFFIHGALPSHFQHPAHNFLRLTRSFLFFLDTAHVPCKFFRQGACQAGSACPFSHDIGAAAENVCKYFAKVRAITPVSVSASAAASTILPHHGLSSLWMSSSWRGSLWSNKPSDVRPVSPCTTGRQRHSQSQTQGQTFKKTCGGR